MRDQRRKHSTQTDSTQTDSTQTQPTDSHSTQLTKQPTKQLTHTSRYRTVPTQKQVPQHLQTQTPQTQHHSTCTANQVWALEYLQYCREICTGVARRKTPISCSPVDEQSLWQRELQRTAPGLVLVGAIVAVLSMNGCPRQPTKHNCSSSREHECGMYMKVSSFQVLARCLSRPHASP
ncbi:uncharacterized protein YALI1_F08597g [Yarrowia lipolytica]|uniref:Uncharacterized protein n=1 Tax=Yarrowia lipolytica TaxID=4952 RepID=A0A1D8NM51_YARLL|nr:hypothetical protein YALI1_F08597g [Yarrowia lipolytica]